MCRLDVAEMIQLLLKWLIRLKVNRLHNVYIVLL